MYWPLRFPDLKPLDFYVWNHIIIENKIINIDE